MALSSQVKPMERKAALKEDQWTEEVEAHQLLCRGCKSWIALRSDREYDIRNWDKHKQLCPRICGQESRRFAVKTKAPARATVSVYIHAFQDWV